MTLYDSTSLRCPTKWDAYKAIITFLTVHRWYFHGTPSTPQNDIVQSNFSTLSNKVTTPSWLLGEYCQTHYGDALPRAHNYMCPSLAEIILAFTCTKQESLIKHIRTAEPLHYANKSVYTRIISPLLCKLDMTGWHSVVSQSINRFILCPVNLCHSLLLFHIYNWLCICVSSHGAWVAKMHCWGFPYKTGIFETPPGGRFWLILL